ncbi:MAG: choice-of-anchor V domain-containing protein [Methanosarcinales archaeon]
MNTLSKNKKKYIRIGLIAGIFLALTLSASAYSSGPPDGKTGAPGEGVCTECHSNFELNSGDGVLQINDVPDTYTPGQTYTITVSLRDPEQSRWGFELKATSGEITVTDDINTQKSGDYIKHTSTGTRAGTADGPVNWSFDWTAPSNVTEDVIFYVAGNAANNNGATSGDYIYTTNVTSSKPTEVEQTLNASIARGKELFNDPNLGTTGDTCNTCHLNYGTEDNPTPINNMIVDAFDNLRERYPREWEMNGKVMTLLQVIEFCIQNPLNGSALPLGDQRLIDLAAYVASVNADKPPKEPIVMTDKLKAAIDSGRELFNDSSIGTNGNTCNTCHLNYGTLDNPTPMNGFIVDAFDNLATQFPQRWPMTEKVMTLTDVIDFCIQNPLEGPALDINNPIITNLTAYSAFVKKGDLDGNGEVDIEDVTAVAYMVVGLTPEDLRADFNKNGEVDIGDASKIAFFLAGKIDKL